MRFQSGIAKTCILFGITIIVLLGIATVGHAAKARLRLVSGSTGGAYYVIMAGMATLIEKYAKDTSANVQAGTTVTENLKLVGKKDADMGIGGTDSAYHAYRGTREFDRKFDKLRWLMKGYSSMNHAVVLKNSPYQRIEDLKGKKIASYPGSTAEYQTPAVLEAFNMIPGRDYVKVPLNIGEAAAALRDGNIDAIMQMGGVPMSAVTDLATTKGIRFLDIPEANQAVAVAKHPWLIRGKIPAGGYTGLTQDILTLGHDVSIFCHADLSPDLVYAIMSAVLDHSDELNQIHPMGKFFKAETGFIGSGVIMPLHPGAEKYYRDRGVLK